MPIAIMLEVQSEVKKKKYILKFGRDSIQAALPQLP